MATSKQERLTNTTSSKLEDKTALERRSSRKIVGALATVAATATLLSGSAVEDHRHSRAAVATQTESAGAQINPATSLEPEVLSYEATREAAGFIQNDRMVQAVTEQALASFSQINLSQQVFDSGSLRVNVSGDNHDYLSGPDGIACTQDDRYEAGRIVTDAILYQGGTGVISMQMEPPRGQELCEKYTSEESVKLVLEVKHSGIDTFSLEESLTQIVRNPERAIVSTVGVKSADLSETLRVTNSNMTGTELSGTDFKVMHNGNEVPLASIDEARRYANEVVESATVVASQSDQQ